MIRHMKKDNLETQERKKKKKKKERYILLVRRDLSEISIASSIYCEKCQKLIIKAY